jgi:hypothetical protein
MNPPDLHFEDLGTVCILQPRTQKGRNWMQKHVAFASWQVVGSSTIAVDHRLADDLKRAAAAGGLTTQE